MDNKENSNSLIVLVLFMCSLTILILTHKIISMERDVNEISQKVMQLQENRRLLEAQKWNR